MPTNPMKKSDASRIQSTQDKSRQDTGKGSFASRAQSAADKNENLTRSQAQLNQAAGTYQEQQRE
ncbi:hypothetical protein ABG067_009621, partial [Albugo candida]